MADLERLSGGLVAYVGHNALSPSDVGGLIRQGHAALRNLGQTLAPPIEPH